MKINNYLKHNNYKGAISSIQAYIVFKQVYSDPTLLIGNQIIGVLRLDWDLSFESLPTPYQTEVQPLHSYVGTQHVWDETFYPGFALGRKQGIHLFFNEKDKKPL